MNPLRAIVATALILGLATSADAQSDQSPDASGGAQSTLGEFVADAFEDLGTLYQEAVRQYWLTNSDIRMMMKAHDEGTEEERFGPSNLFILREAPSDGSLYAEFDWDNLAMSMRARDSGGKSSIEFFLLGAEVDTSDEATDVTMYFDAGGNVYVPTEDGRYVSANLGDVLGGMFESLEFHVQAVIDSGVTEMLDGLLALSTVSFPGFNIYSEFLPGEVGDVVSEYPAVYVPEEGWHFNEEAQLAARLERLLEELAQAHYATLTKFPLINFVFFSPTLARSHGNVREESITWGGQSGATKFTVTSGSDAGYVIIFDGAGRLVLLRDTDGNTAEYMYDRDVSVP